MRCMVTGGAGFIGSVLTDRLVAEGHEVVVYDNLSSGRREFLAGSDGKPGFSFVQADLLDLETLAKAMAGVETVFHIAANPDIRYGTDQTDVDLRQGVLATYNVLEAMRRNDVGRIVFSSSSVVYGEAQTIPTPEDYGPLCPISLYGASKLAAEGYISAYCGTFGLRAWIFRFANIIGRRGTHGVLVDFLNKLSKDPTRLEVLGDGRQAKSYLLVDDCVDAILFAVGKATEQVNIFNIGTEDRINVARIAEIVLEETGAPAKIEYTGGDRGWKGDVRVMTLSTKRIRDLGWRCDRGSEEAVREAVRELMKEGYYRVRS